MRSTVYTVRACRWGDRETHSYIVGVFEKKHAAQEAAKAEEEWRGGKYECEILEWELGTPNTKGGGCLPHKVIKALPKIA